MDIKKFILLTDLSNKRYNFYAYIDYQDNSLDSLFIQEKIPVKFMEEMRKKGLPWKIVQCRVSRKDAERFEKAFDKANAVLLLKGHKGWLDMCKQYLN